MTDQTTRDLIEEAARRIAKDIIGGKMTATERYKAFQILTGFYKETSPPVEPPKADDASFASVRDRLNALDVATLEGAKNGMKVAGNGAATDELPE